MKIFVSWSGDRSRAVAGALKPWLRDVFQDLHVWMSDHDIQAGSRWGVDLGAELEQAEFGILCLTAENVFSPWLLYEAGSLAKTVKVARVVPYLLDLKPTDVAGPLSQFHSVATDREGTFRLLESINSHRADRIEADRLQRLFEKWWPDLESHLSRIPPLSKQVRTDRSIMEELLERVRSIDGRIAVGPADEPEPAPWTRLPLLGPQEIVALSDADLEAYKADLNQLYMGPNLVEPDEENAILPVLIEAEEELRRRARRALTAQNQDGEPVPGYDGMDGDTLLEWLNDAGLDRDTLLRIRAYESANHARDAVLKGVDALLG